jgi:hypothetical protein
MSARPFQDPSNSPTGATVSPLERSAMRKAAIRAILHTLAGALLLSLISGTGVWLASLMLGWETAAQLSDGFFWTGALMIVFGFVSYQGYRQRSLSWPTTFLDPTERSNLWTADTFRGQNLMLIFGISGLLLLGFSFLVVRLF